MPSKKPTKNRKILFQEAVGKGSVFRIFPEDLVLETNESGLLYDVRATEAPDEAFVKNIMKHGIIQPITVKKIDDRPVVVAGRRRVLAAREANRRIMEQGGEPCVIVPCVDAANAKTDEDLYGIFIAENAIRRDESPISRAEKAKHLLTLSQGNIEQVAITMGCSMQTIRNLMKLLELSAPVKKAVDTGKLSVSAAMELHGLSFNRQQEALKEVLESTPGKGRHGGKPTAREVSAAAGHHRKPKIRSRKEIKAKLEEEIHFGSSAVIETLRWVLRIDEE